MPEFISVRQGITPAVRPVPTDTTLIVLPMTLERVGKEVEDEDESPARIDSVNGAFEQFKPTKHFETTVGEDSTAFVVELEFHSLKDFALDTIQKRVPGKRNDIADLKNIIDLLYRLKERWSLPAVKRAWNDPHQRQQILAAVARLRIELEKVTQDGKGGEMAEQEVITATMGEIFAVAETPQVRKVLADIFPDLHTRLGEEKTALASIFTPETASEFLSRLTQVESLLVEMDTYQETLQKFQAQIDTAEQVRDEVLAQLFAQLRPLEASYRQLWLFFENSVVPDGKQRKPVECFVFNADAGAMQDRESVTLEAIRRFVASRNDNFNFRDDICNLVVPGPIPMMVREALEEEAWKWGMLLVTDLADERSFKDVVNQFRSDGRYEFLKRPDNKAASDVVMVGYLKLRDAHWFERGVNDGEDLYAPASVIFAGALARTDRARGSIVQGPIGPKFGQIKGVEKARVECLISQMTLLSQEMQVIPIIRDADNHLCFYGCRSLADDPYGVYKFFTAYRVLAYLERVIANRLREVAGQVLTREFMDEEIEKPLRRLLEEQKSQGTIMHYDLFVDKDSHKRMQGICDVLLEVMPTGPAEVFRVKIDVPEFVPSGAEPTRGGSGT